ncbi:hypothetical protein G6F22_021317 [Rhizopus arrhizus]|nr:hypothetical protein G6F22_021317 [Rhizopus arrhizus]
MLLTPKEVEYFRHGGLLQAGPALGHIATASAEHGSALQEEGPDPHGSGLFRLHTVPPASGHASTLQIMAARQTGATTFSLRGPWCPATTGLPPTQDAHPAHPR